MANKLIQWNCRGLKANFNELILLLTGMCPSIICLQETFLKPSDNLNIRGYNIFINQVIGLLVVHLLLLIIVYPRAKFN